MIRSQLSGQIWIRLLTLLTSLFLLTSCLKPPSEKAKTKDDFGPEITVTDLKAQYVTMPAPSIYNIQKDDYAAVERRQIVEQNRPTVVSSTATTVKNRTDSDSKIEFTWQHDLLEYVNGQPKPEPSKREFIESIAKKNSSFLNFLEKLVFPFQLKFSFMTESVASKGEIQIYAYPSFRPQRLSASKVTYSYHNFTRKEVILSVPEPTKERPNCGGRNVDLCVTGLRAEQITFDEVAWEEGKSPRKVSNLMITSADVPYFFQDTSRGPELISFVLNCAEGLIELPSQKVHVIDCTEVKDFRLGPL